MDCPFISEKAIVHYRDIYDHLAKFFELTETYREIETSLMELYTSLLNNLMTKMSNNTNASVRRLTLIATIFMPLTLIASIGGMSEWSMMTGPSNWKIAYPLFLLGMVVIGIADYYLITTIEKRGKSRKGRAIGQLRLFTVAKIKHCKMFFSKSPDCISKEKSGKDIDTIVSMCEEQSKNYNNQTK